MLENKKREHSKPFLSRKKTIWVGGGIASVIIASALIMNLSNNEPAPTEHVKGVSQEQKVEEPEQTQEENQQEAVKEPQEVAAKETEQAVAATNETPVIEEAESADLTPKGGPVNPDEVMDSATPDRTNEPFDFMYILNHPQEFKDAASKGRLLGVNAAIGDSYDTVVARNGEPTGYGMYEGAFLYTLGKDYYLSYPGEKQGEVLSVNVKRQSPTVKLEQVIDVFGEPYYFYNALEDRFYLLYRSGDFVITMGFEGLNKRKEEESITSIDVSKVDLGSFVTSIEIHPAKYYPPRPEQEIEYISDNETLDFDEKWFALAKDKTLNLFEIDDVQHTSVEKMLQFRLFVEEDTTEEEAKEMIHTFLTELTSASEEDLQPIDERLWDHYKYSVDVFRKENGKYTIFLQSHGFKGNMGDCKTIMNPHGYPEPNWS